MVTNSLSSAPYFFTAALYSRCLPGTVAELVTPFIAVEFANEFLNASTFDGNSSSFVCAPGRSSTMI